MVVECRHWEKDIDNFVHNDELFLDGCIHENSDYAHNLSNRVEKDLLHLHHSQSMNSGRWRETLSPRISGDVSNHQRIHVKTNGMVTGVIGRMTETILNEEFPLLGAEHQHGSSGTGRVLSSSSHSLVTDNSMVVVSNGLNMAEILARGPTHSRTPPQVSLTLISV